MAWWRHDSSIPGRVEKVNHYVRNTSATSIHLTGAKCGKTHSTKLGSVLVLHWISWLGDYLWHSIENLFRGKSKRATMTSELKLNTAGKARAKTQLVLDFIGQKKFFLFFLLTFCISNVDLGFIRSFNITFYLVELPKIAWCSLFKNFLGGL